MADVYDAASANSDDQKRQALVALAAGGQSAVQALAAGQQQVAALRDAQLKAALADASGAPASAAALLNQRISSPYNQTQASMVAGSTARQQDLANVQGATSAYFDQVKGSVPFARALGQERKAKADREAALQEREMALREKELTMKQAALDAESADPFSKMSDAELRTRAMGAGEIDRTAAFGAAQKRVQGGGFGAKSAFGSMGRVANKPTAAYAREAAIAAGAGEARATGAIPLPGPPKPAKAPAQGSLSRDAKIGQRVGLSPPSVVKSRTSKQYQDKLGVIQSLIDQGQTKAQIRAALLSSDAYKRYPKTMEVLMADTFG